MRDLEISCVGSLWWSSVHMHLASYYVYLCSSHALNDQLFWCISPVRNGVSFTFVQKASGDPEHPLQHLMNKGFQDTLVWINLKLITFPFASLIAFIGSTEWWSLRTITSEALLMKDFILKILILSSSFA